MSQTQQVSVTGVAASSPLLLDPNSSAGVPPGVFLDMGAGCTATVQVTPDDPASGSALWVATGVAALTGATADVAAALPFAARGIRLNQTAGAAASVLKVVPSGIR